MITRCMILIYIYVKTFKGGGGERIVSGDKFLFCALREISEPPLGFSLNRFFLGKICATSRKKNVAHEAEQLSFVQYSVLFRTTRNKICAYLRK